MQSTHAAQRRSSVEDAALRWRCWAALAVVLLLCLPPLLVETRERLSTHTMENVALVTSQETWLRMAAGETRAWLVSSNDGQPRLEKPPLLTWLNLLAWSDLDPASASPQLLTFRARCVSATLGMLMLASIFWMGHTLGGCRMAALAALTVGSTLFFQRQARTASYDIHYVAWSTLAVAAGLWAIRPFQPSSTWRMLLGWGVCALGLCAAAMSKNPLPYLLALPPLIAAIVHTSTRKGRDCWWLTAAVLISTAPVIAWYWHVFANYQDVANKALGREVIQPRAGDFQPVYYYLGLLGLIVPWSLWLIGGLIEPFKMPRGHRRRQAMFALFWFAFIFIMLSIPAAKQQRYILAVLPAAGLLIAGFLHVHDDRARSDAPDRFFIHVHSALWIALGIASALLASFLAMPGRFVGWFSDGTDPVIQALPIAVALSIGLALAALCVVGWTCRATKPWRSAVIMSLWMLMAMTIFWRQEARLPSPRIEPFVAEATRIRAIVGDRPLHSMRWIEQHPRAAAWDWKINEEFRLYFGRLLPRVPRPDGPAWLAQQPAGAFVLVRSDPQAASHLTQNGWRLIDHVHVDSDDVQELWRRDASE